MDLVTQAQAELEARGWKIELEAGKGYVLMDPLGNLILDRGELHWKDLREAVDAADRAEDKRKQRAW